MRRAPVPLALLFLLAAAAAPAAAAPRDPADPPVVCSARERVDLGTGGEAQVTLLVVFGEGIGPAARLPFDCPYADRLAARLADGATLEAALVTRDGVELVELAAADGADLAGRTAEVTYRDPAFLTWRKAGPGEHGVYRWRNDWLNRTTTLFEAFELTVILPPGFTLRAVERSEPAATKKDAAPPFLFSREGGRSAVTIRGRELGAGGRVMLDYTFVEERRSPLVVALMLLAGAVWLVAFRDLKPGRAAALLLAALSLAGCGTARPLPLEPVLEFGERGRRPGTFLNPDGIATHSGEVYVADVGRVHVFDTAGVFLRAIGNPGIGPGRIRREAVGVAVSPAGIVAVSDEAARRVLLFAPDGSAHAALQGGSAGPFLRPQGVAFDAAGNLFVSDHVAGRIEMFVAACAPVRTLGAPGNGAAGLSEPESLALFAGELFVADEGHGRVLVFSLDGTFRRRLGAAPSPPPVMPGPDPDAGFIPADAVSLFSRDVEGIALDAVGFLYAAAEDEGAILLFGPDGRRLGAFTSAARGGLKRPQGLAVDRALDRLYVVDLGNSRVQAFPLPAVRAAFGIR